MSFDMRSDLFTLAPKLEPRPITADVANGIRTQLNDIKEYAEDTSTEVSGASRARFYNQISMMYKALSRSQGINQTTKENYLLI